MDGEGLTVPSWLSRYAHLTLTPGKHYKGKLIDDLR